MYNFHAANQRLHHLLVDAAEVSEDEPLQLAHAALSRFVTRGVEAGEFTVDDPRRPPRSCSTAFTASWCAL